MRVELKKIPVFKPRPLDWLRASELASSYGNPNQLSNFGPLVALLERKLADLLNVHPDQVVIFSNCTDAIAGSLATLEDIFEAVIPGFSFVATLRAAQVSMPGSFRIEDVDPVTWALTPNLNGSEHEVYVPVAPFGVDPSATLRRFEGRKVIVDAAASLATFPDLSNLAHNQSVCFSLHATKVLGAGEGGFGVYGDIRWAARARSWSNFGRDESEFQKHGTNSKMSEVQAAFCLARLETKNEELFEWMAAQNIASTVTHKHSLKVQPHAFETVHPYWTLELESGDQRVRLEAELRARGIGYRRWWPADLSVLAGKPTLQVSSELARRTLGLPLFCGLTESNGERISEALAASGI